jgi:hypothetical protein
VVPQSPVAARTSDGGRLSAEPAAATADALDSAALASLARRYIEAGLRHMVQRMTALQATYVADKPLVSLCKTITRACKTALHSACHREYMAHYALLVCAFDGWLQPFLTAPVAPAADAAATTAAAAANAAAELPSTPAAPGGAAASASAAASPVSTEHSAGTSAPPSSSAHAAEAVQEKQTLPSQRIVDFAAFESALRSFVGMELTEIPESREDEHLTVCRDGEDATKTSADPLHSAWLEVWQTFTQMQAQQMCAFRRLESVHELVHSQQEVPLQLAFIAAALLKVAAASAITATNKQDSAPVCPHCPSDPFLSALLVHQAMLNQSAHAAMWRLQQQLKDSSAVLQPLLADFGPAGATREAIGRQITAAATRSQQLKEVLHMWEQQEQEREQQRRVEAERMRREAERMRQEAERARQDEYDRAIVKCQRRGCTWSGMRKNANERCMLRHVRGKDGCLRVMKSRHCQRGCDYCFTACARCEAVFSPFKRNGDPEDSWFEKPYCAFDSHEITS